jgi:Flp pilus assembly protein TadG
MPPPSPARRKQDEGSVTIEAIGMAMVLILIIVILGALGRASDAHQQVSVAAHAAARAASLARTAAGARAAAHDTAEANLRVTTSCTHPQITVDAARFAPGGSVTVTVTCTIQLADLGLPGLPGTMRVFQASVSPIDLHRGVSP